MAAKIAWTVRVVQFKDEKFPGYIRHDELPDFWVEQLRYMGFARELATFDEPKPRTVIEFYAPRGADSKIWADQNAGRMRSFGINAAAAPQWHNVSIYGREGELERAGMKT